MYAVAADQQPRCFVRGIANLRRTNNVLLQVMKCFLALVLLVSPVISAPGKISIDPQPAHAAPRTLNGIFFEDTNYCADGRLCAELVPNRSFEHQDQ
jgi:hypothetical protein